jgi:hypothetical protein
MWERLYAVTETMSLVRVWRIAISIGIDHLRGVTPRGHSDVKKELEDFLAE